MTFEPYSGIHYIFILICTFMYNVHDKTYTFILIYWVCSKGWWIDGLDALARRLRTKMCWPVRFAKKVDKMFDCWKKMLAIHFKLEKKINKKRNIVSNILYCPKVPKLNNKNLQCPFKPFFPPASDICQKAFQVCW